ncbi:hypothetical protein B0H10DRAFT_2433752 [Mycena sp. CBHHK59/15]|nr:hypothetical protein B0H10DRAFT_2433752 [Mycena sp. CBHHK59/15]
MPPPLPLPLPPPAAPLPPLLPMSLLRTLLANAPDTNAPAPTADAPAPRSCSRCPPGDVPNGDVDTPGADVPALGPAQNKGEQPQESEGGLPAVPKRPPLFLLSLGHSFLPAAGFKSTAAKASTLCRQNGSAERRQTSIGGKLHCQYTYRSAFPPDFPRQGGLPSSSPAAFDMPPFRLPPMRSLLRSLLPFRFPAARATPGPRRSLLIFEHMSDAARALVLGEGSEGGEVAGIDRAVVRLPACGSTPAIVTMPVDADTHLSALLAHPTPAELTTTVEEAEMAEVTPGRSTIAANLPVPHRQPAQDGGADVPTTEDERRLVADWAAARIALLHSVIVGPAPGPGPAFAPRLRAPSPPQPVAARGASSGGR